MISVPTTVAIIVATKAAAKSMPESDKIAGFTAMINDMVKKVDRPATTSRLTVVLCSDSRNKRSNITHPPITILARSRPKNVTFVAKYKQLRIITKIV